MAQLHATWTEQLGALAQCFLHFKTGNPSSMPSHYPQYQEGTDCIYILCIDIFGELLKNIHTINIIDFNPTDGQSFQYVPQEATDIYPSFSLMHARYLLPTPSDPQVVFSILSLELLHSLFHAASNFTIQSFSHLLTDMHKVNKPFLPCMLTHNHVGSQVIYWSHLKTQISLTFNIFY